MVKNLHPKVKTGALVSAIVTVLSLVLGLSPELQGALTTVLGAAAGYLTPSK